MNLTRTHGGSDKTRRVCVVSECGGPVMMADRPILFSDPMIRALLDGRKTQTRRVIKPAYETGGGCPMFPSYLNGKRIGESSNPDFDDLSEFNGGYPLYGGATTICPGDRLWVREAWHAARSLDRTPPRDIPRDADIEHAATARSYAEIGLKGKLRPSIHMPRWASRLTLIVSDVRVQRLQEIDEADAVAEGIVRLRVGGLYGLVDADWAAMSAREAYAELWDGLNASRGFGWNENPWVVALTFTVHRRNIDTLEQAT